MAGSPLRRQMTSDMTVNRLSENTQTTYVREIVKLEMDTSV